MVKKSRGRLKAGDVSASHLIRNQFEESDGTWLLIQRNRLTRLNGDPCLPFSLLANSTTGTYSFRIFDQTVERGIFHNNENLEKLIRSKFDETVLCIGEIQKLRSRIEEVRTEGNLSIDGCPLYFKSTDPAELESGSGTCPLCCSQINDARPSKDSVFLDQDIADEFHKSPEAVVHSKYLLDSPKKLDSPVGQEFPDQLISPERLECLERPDSLERLDFPERMHSAERQDSPERLDYLERPDSLERQDSHEILISPENLDPVEQFEPVNGMNCDEFMCSEGSMDSSDMENAPEIPKSEEGLLNSKGGLESPERQASEKILKCLQNKHFKRTFSFRKDVTVRVEKLNIEKLGREIKSLKIADFTNVSISSFKINHKKAKNGESDKIVLKIDKNKKSGKKINYYRKALKKDKIYDQITHSSINNDPTEQRANQPEESSNSDMDELKDRLVIDEAEPCANSGHEASKISSTLKSWGHAAPELGTSSNISNAENQYSPIYSLTSKSKECQNTNIDFQLYSELEIASCTDSNIEKPDPTNKYSTYFSTTGETTVCQSSDVEEEDITEPLNTSSTEDSSVKSNVPPTGSGEEEQTLPSEGSAVIKKNNISRAQSPQLEREESKISRDSAGAWVESGVGGGFSEGGLSASLTMKESNTHPEYLNTEESNMSRNPESAPLSAFAEQRDNKGIGISDKTISTIKLSDVFGSALSKNSCIVSEGRVSPFKNVINPKEHILRPPVTVALPPKEHILRPPETAALLKIMNEIFFVSKDCEDMKIIPARVQQSNQQSDQISLKKKRGRPRKIVIKEDLTNRKKLSELTKKKISENNKKFSICKLCVRQCRGFRGLVDHMLRDHPTHKPWACQYCPVSTAFVKTLYRHLKTEHGICESQCPKCGKKYTRAQSMLAHVNKHEMADQLTFPCTECTQSFNSQEKLDQHLDKHHTYVCDMCEEKFSEVNVLKEHRKTHARGSPLYCVECGSTFSHQSAFTNHMKTHLREKGLSKAEARVRLYYDCDICGKSYVNSGGLRLHKRQLHEHYSENLLCNICGISFRTRELLKQHKERSHSDVPRFACDICDQRFGRRYHLKRHRTLHTADGFPCSKCSRVFKREDGLKLHMKSHRCLGVLNSEDPMAALGVPSLSRGEEMMEFEEFGNDAGLLNEEVDQKEKVEEGFSGPEEQQQGFTGGEKFMFKIHHPIPLYPVAPEPLPDYSTLVQPAPLHTSTCPPAESPCYADEAGFSSVLRLRPDRVGVKFLPELMEPAPLGDPTHPRTHTLGYLRGGVVAPPRQGRPEHLHRGPHQHNPGLVNYPHHEADRKLDRPPLEAACHPSLPWGSQLYNRPAESNRLVGGVTETILDIKVLSPPPFNEHCMPPPAFIGPAFLLEQPGMNVGSLPPARVVATVPASLVGNKGGATADYVQDQNRAMSPLTNADVNNLLCLPPQDQIPTNVPILHPHMSTPINRGSGIGSAHVELTIHSQGSQPPRRSVIMMSRKN